jgi:hypothetical protein
MAPGTPAPAPQNPSIGRIVHYIPTEDERRDIAESDANAVQVGEPVCAIVVAVWPPSNVVNLRAIVDGAPEADFWVGTVMHESEMVEGAEGFWRWPPRVG